MQPASRIPEPPRLPVIRHLHHIDFDAPLQSMVELAKRHGPLFRLEFPTGSMLLLGSHALVDEVCDERRFRKAMHNVLLEARHIAGDGLFTAYDDEPNWALAHRILMPAFGPLSLREMFPAMLELATQLVDRWERLGPSVFHDVPDQMTRLTLDTIALCGFGFRFNSLYREDQHPFVEAMLRSLREAGDRSRRPRVQTRMMGWATRRFEADIASMRGVVEQVIRERRADPEAPSDDLLARMLSGRDPITGESLDDANISNQIVTFLIAGHETTSGLLSFALYALSRHPEVLARARAEVDRVIGNGPGTLPRFEQLAQLTYLDQVLRESLRLWPTAPVFGMTPREDTLIAGRYPVRAGENLLALLPALHRDPAVWGQDAELFRPERFAPDVRDAIPQHAYKPFGNGVRACIGRPFAMQESLLLLAMILARFEIEPEPGYELRIKETLTLKPDAFRLRARARTRRSVVGLSVASPVSSQDQAQSVAPRARHGTPLRVVFGSSGGTSEGLAQRLVQQALGAGYDATCSPLDANVAVLPRDGALVVVCASYNGEPSHNARAFHAWLDTLPERALAGVQFAVFGCGHSDWAATYQAVPRRLDQVLEAKGASRLMARGEGDAARDLFGAYAEWSNELLETLARRFLPDQARADFAHPSVEIDAAPCARLARHGVQLATVVRNEELIQGPCTARSKRHIELRLPPSVTYRTGDYLRVLPRNPPELVARAASLLGLPLSGSVRRAEAGAGAPSQVIAVLDLLEEQLELNAKAQPSHVALLARCAKCPPELRELERLAEAAEFERHVAEPALSILDLLERFPSARPSLAELLALWPPLSTRRYSIASSPLHAPEICALTVAVLDQEARSGHGRHRGTASHFLARVAPGDLLPVAVEPGPERFRMPEESTLPVILIAAGTGVAPFRAFVQERRAARAAGASLGRALLYFGCDHPEQDFLYRAELEQAEREGVVELRTTFCRAPVEDLVFVQHRMWREREELLALLAQGAHVRVCGDARTLAPAVRATWQRILMSQPSAPTLGDLEQSGRYVVDAFS